MTDSSSLHPWQLEMFQRSIKKQRKLEALLKYMGDPDGKECLFITCGDNNGALNWYFREQGGNWVWADVSGENIEDIAELLNEPVIALKEDDFPFPDEHFNFIVSIDVLEHLPQDKPFLLELSRVLKTGGRAIVTVPNGDPRLIANRIKLHLGMTPEVYGHTRAGYTVSELCEAISRARLKPIESGGYSRFFTEMIELAINYTYVNILGRKQRKKTPGHIAPVSSQEINQHSVAYRLYSFFFPVARVFSYLDLLLSNKTNNAVIIMAEKVDIQ